ncbi:MAG: PEGA domain-containing protein, partial [Myxococcales bacterium]
REEGPAETSQTQAAAQSGQSGQSGQGGPGGTGLLIVTTTPRGLLVQVDDTAVDLTPMRTKVRPGSHRVALLDGDRKVYETTMDVRDGSIATLQKDLSAEQAGEPARPAVLAPPSSREQSQATVTPMDSSDTGQPNPSVGASTRAPAAFTTPRPIAGGQTPSLSGDGTGALSISSPGLYGVVWINGRPRGYPPLEVRNLPSGPVKIEVRVNGVQKRSSTVVVRAGSTTPVRIQSQEPSP